MVCWAALVEIHVGERELCRPKAGTNRAAHRQMLQRKISVTAAVQVGMRADGAKSRTDARQYCGRSDVFALCSESSSNWAEHP